MTYLKYKIYIRLYIYSLSHYDSYCALLKGNSFFFPAQPISVHLHFNILI